MTPALDDLEALAWRVLGYEQASAVAMCHENKDHDAEMAWDLDSALERRFGCDFSRFCHLVEKLLPLMPLLPDDRDGRQHHAFPVDGAVIVRAATDSAD